MIGHIKSFDAQRGFGFIERPPAKDLFVHISQVSQRECLAPGDQVEFEVGEHKGQPCAVSVGVTRRVPVRPEPVKRRAATDATHPITPPLQSPHV